MAAITKLNSFLNDEEISSLSNEIKSKIEDHLGGIHGSINELQNENDKLRAVSERYEFQLEKEVLDSQTRLKDSLDECLKLRTSVSELEEKLSIAEKTLKSLKKTHDDVTLDLESCKRSNLLLTQEKQDLAEMLQKRRKEIDELNGKLKTLSDEVVKANNDKYEAIAKMEEVDLKGTTLQHQLNRREQETHLFSEQLEALNQEVAQKSHEILTLRKEKSTCVLELQTELETKVEELQLAQSQLNNLKKKMEEKDNRIEALAQRLREHNESHTNSEEQFNVELRAQTKLVALYKQSSEESQEKAQQMLRALEEMQKVMKEMGESHSKVEQSLKSVQEESDLKLQEKENQLNNLQQELQHANELLSKNKGFSKENLEKLFPTAAATSKALQSGMTLTQLYSEFVKIQEEFQKEKVENQKLNQQLKQIVAEIEENTPVINQRLQEYHKAVETISCLRNQLASSLVDQERLQAERDDACRIRAQLQKESDRLKQQIRDLSKQTCILLKEVEEARGGYVRMSGRSSRSNRREQPEVSSSDDISTASGVISRHLVTFMDIEDLQSKNQQLLAVVRDLSAQLEVQEKKSVHEKTSELQKDLEKALAELEELQKDRVRQAEIVESIVRQRDMYRVILTHQGFSPSLLGMSSSMSSGKGLDDSQLTETKAALKQLQLEYDNYRKERGENTKILNEQLDKLREEVSDLRIKNAKLSSQIEYSEERFNLLQSSLDNYKREAASFREKNQKHTTVITQHQQTINTLRQDLMASHEKLAKAEVSANNLQSECELLKSVETRLLQEKESMLMKQHQQARHIANLETVQNNMEIMSSGAVNNLKSQVEKLEKECRLLRTKLENENEHYRSAVKVWEKQTQDLQLKIERENDRNSRTHDDLVDAYSQVHELKQQLNNAETNLRKANEKLVKTEILENASKGTEVKNLKDQLSEAQNEIKNLQGKLEIAQKSATHYQTLSSEVETHLKEQNEACEKLKDTAEASLKSYKNSENQLNKQIEELEKQNRSLKSALTALKDEKQKEVTKLQQQLLSSQKEVASKKEFVQESEVKVRQARDDLQNQAAQKQEAQEKYERELMLHAADMQQLTSIKEELATKEEKIEEAKAAARQAEEALMSGKLSWEKREEILIKDYNNLKIQHQDLQKQNEALHHQLELVGTRMAALHSKAWDEKVVENPKNPTQSTEHLLDVIKYLRREKEIASTECDAAQSETTRLKIKCEQLEKSLHESTKELKALNENSEAVVESEAQHADLLRKIEMMNVLTESNRLLRDEKEELIKAQLALESKIAEYEKELKPLKTSNMELTSKLEAVTLMNVSVKEEAKRWQNRTNQLLEQPHKVETEEFKKLSKELEDIRKKMPVLHEELRRKQAEISHGNASLANVRKELDNVKNEAEKHKNEVQKWKTEVEKLKTEIEKHSAEQNKVISESKSKMETLVNDCNEKQKSFVQVKKIARKYKAQYDELKVLYDKLVQQPPPTVEKAAAAPASKQDTSGMQEKKTELEQKLKQSEEKLKQSEESLKTLMEEKKKLETEVENVKKEKEVAKTSAIEKDDRTKKVILQAKQRISQLTNQKSTLTKEKETQSKELSDLKAQLAALKQEIEEENLRSSTLKSQYEMKFNRQEKELKNAKENIERLEKELELNQKQKQGTKLTASAGLVERGNVPQSEPLTANIKPIASSVQAGVASIRHQPHPHTVAASTRSTPTASIKPMAIGSGSSTPHARMAAVLPTTAASQTVPSDEASTSGQPCPLPQATVAPTPAVTSATLTLAPSTVAVITEHPSATVAPSSHTLVISEATSLSSDLDPEAVSPTTSVIVSPASAAQTQVVTPTVKRQREDAESTSDAADPIATVSSPSTPTLKRQRMLAEPAQTSRQTSEASSSTSSSQSNVAVVSAAVVTPVAEESSVQSKDSNKDVEKTNVTSSSSSATILISEAPSTSRDPEVAKVIQESDTPSKEPVKDTTPLHQFKVPEEVILVESEEEEEEAEVSEIQKRTEEDNMAEDEQIADEGDEEMVDQPAEEDDDEIIADVPESEYQMDDQDSTSIPSCGIATPMHVDTSAKAETSSAASLITTTEAVAGTSSSPMYTRPPLLPRIPARSERLPSAGRQLLTPFTIPGQGPSYEETGDDSIVPSTPTLFVPRRSDGFSEAVSSPHVPQSRFFFNNAAEVPSSQQGLSQLATQALGMDDTRMDLSLSQFDESSGRSVPSTPLQVSPPGTDANVSEVSETSTIELTSSSPVTVISNIDAPQTTQIIPTITVTCEDSQETRVHLTERTQEEQKEKSDSTLSVAGSAESPKEETSTIKKLERKEIDHKDIIETSPPSTSSPVVAPEKTESHSTEAEKSESPTESASTPEESGQKEGESTSQRKPIVWQPEPSTVASIHPVSLPQQSFSSPTLSRDISDRDPNYRSQRGGRRGQLKGNVPFSPPRGAGYWRGTRRGGRNKRRGGPMY